ncbi:MAG: hypothetical protein K0Q79_3185 [Flavipsychrobacter sp.]|jgi:glycosyltransferase involved in cell wall biosynthesis|nr:hypothetical protein [Flavipsychrobacter sp.]
MNFVFWQNIISIHQKAFLEALVKQPGVGNVMLVVEHELTPVRKSMGWDTPEIQGVEVVLSPSENSIKEIVRANKDAVHVMGGIRIGRMITVAFDTCVQTKCRIGIMTEPYDDAGWKGKLRKAKYSLYRMKYFKHIGFVLAIGRQGVAQYTELGFDSKRLFAWAYFITLEQPLATAPPSKDIRIIYAGRLEEAKGIYRFARELFATGARNCTLDIYGEGSDEEKIKQLVAEYGLTEKVSFTRYIKYAELLERYRHYDWVVLPSTQKDGWGVVVSEGLLNGLKAICSRKCGVSWAIKEGWNGVTFDWQQEGSCRNAINKMLTGEDFATQNEISGWAQCNISGDAGAEYFMKIVGSVYNGNAKPGIPWEV